MVLILGIDIESELNPQRQERCEGCICKGAAVLLTALCCLRPPVTRLLLDSSAAPHCSQWVGQQAAMKAHSDCSLRVQGSLLLKPPLLGT